MHVVIGGYGRVGRYIAQMLESEGHTVAVIDHDADAFDGLEDATKGRKLAGEVFDRDTLEKAGIRQADAFCAVTSGDNSNILSARVARDYFNVPNVIARIYDPRRAELYRDLGIRTVSSVEWTAKRLLRMVTNPEVRTIQQYAGGEIDLVGVDVPAGLDGRAVGDFEVPGKVRAHVIVRQHEAILAEPEVRMQAKDRIYFAVTRGDLAKIEQFFNGEQEA